jgi:hypothetical protein
MTRAEEFGKVPASACAGGAPLFSTLRKRIKNSADETGMQRLVDAEQSDPKSSIFMETADAEVLLSFWRTKLEQRYKKRTI